MKKLLLITIIILLQSFPSFGEWKKVGSIDTGVVYIEIDTIRKKGDKVYYNLLIDYYELGNSGSLSKINREGIDCKNNTLKTFRYIWYQDSMGKGKILDEFIPPKTWGPWGYKFQFHNLIHKLIC